MCEGVPERVGDRVAVGEGVDVTLQDGVDGPVHVVYEYVLPWSASAAQTALDHAHVPVHVRPSLGPRMVPGTHCPSQNPQPQLLLVPPSLAQFVHRLRPFDAATGHMIVLPQASGEA